MVTIQLISLCRLSANHFFLLHYARLALDLFSCPYPTPSEGGPIIWLGYLKNLCVCVLVYCIDVFLSGLLHSVQSAPVLSTSLELIQMYSF